MCSHCGCEAVPVIETLMDNHTEIAARVRRIIQALDEHRLVQAAEFTTQLAATFAHHTAIEEAGLFAQLKESGTTTDDLDRLVIEHARLRAALGDPGFISEPSRLRTVLADLLRHAQGEDTNLFPLALQVLPTQRWDLIEAVHQQLLTA